MAESGGSEDNPIVLISPLKLPKSPESLAKCRFVYYCQLSRVLGQCDFACVRVLPFRNLVSEFSDTAAQSS